MVILRSKSPNRSFRPWDRNRKIHWQTVNLGFEAKSRNSCSSSPCARCRSHTASLDLPIIWPPSTRPVLHNHQSSAPGLLLLPPKIPGFEFKPSQINYSSQLNQGIDHLVSQSLDWWVHWQQKAQNLNFESKTHETQLKDQKSKKSSRKSSRRRKKRKADKGNKKW
jgi:hypothetical protein